MTVYWLLFGYVAIMALLFPLTPERERLGAMQSLAILGFVVAYVLVATLRYQIGGDWVEYQDMYDAVRQGSLRDAVQFTDPVFGIMLWVSGKLHAGIYPVNGLCAALIAVGTVRVAQTTREPWLAILAAVPYLLIVVGMGYVRQAGAIGMIMIAIASLGRARPVTIIGELALAIGLHSTGGIVFPLFGPGLAQRRRWLALVITGLGAVAFVSILSLRIDEFEKGYIEQAYESSGATVRLLMNLLPSLVLLVRWRDFPVEGGARRVWLGFAVASILTFAALIISPSSTAVDRVGFYFAPVQLVVFGSMLDLLRVPRAGIFLVRTVMIGIAALVQMVWLVLATDAPLWVPYHAIFGLM